MVYTNIKKGKSKGDSTKTLQLINKVLTYRHWGVQSHTSKERRG